MNIAVTAERGACDELCCYTLAHGNPLFIHQHIVGAFAAQDASEHDKPIGLTFALVGLYQHVEKQFSGREVQLAHMKLARRKQAWSPFTFPDDRGSITAVDVLAAEAGPERDRMIHEWCLRTWQAFETNQSEVIRLFRLHGIA